MKRLIILSLFIFLNFQLQGQILGGIMNEAKRKLERKIENKIIEAVSEELARRAFKPIDQAIDSLMREKYQDSINGGKPVDWEKAGESYAAFLAGMNKAVDLPEKYTFDVTQEVEIVDYSNKSNKIRMYYSKSDAIMGIEDLEQKDTKQLIVMDISRDAMIIYTTDKKGEKTGQVVPSVMKMASSLAGSVKQDTVGKDQDMKIEKTGKKKKIAGFQSNEYKGSTKEEDFVMFVSSDFPVNWQSNYTAYMSKFAPASYAENSSKIENGIMLQYENRRKDEDKVTTWSTVKVNEKSFDIKKSDYNFEMK